MNIAILGSSGFIGSHLVHSISKQSYKAVEINRNSLSEYFLDLEKPQNFNYDILDSCDFLIITAAISNPDYCAESYEKAYRINVLSTKHVINEAINRNCKVIFLSSDAVYGTDKGTCFNEQNNTNPNTPYGLMKKEIEDSYYGSTLFKSARLSYVISGEDKFIKYLFECKKQGNVAEVFHPFYRNCVTLSEVTDSLIWLLNNWGEFASPFLNICGCELVSRVAIVDEINRLSETKIKYKIVYPSEKFFINRPQITEMSSLYLNRILENHYKPFSMRLRSQLINKM
ncbi:MAG: SDR family oxidoreductase [Bacillota bacterium]